ncbi:hypothetical protein M0804_005082 [Polistes exclamans]|nr:hypothetical protein M0804_005082 [Polistes exclamans]
MRAVRLDTDKVTQRRLASSSELNVSTDIPESLRESNGRSYRQKSYVMKKKSRWFQISVGISYQVLGRRRERSIIAVHTVNHERDTDPCFDDDLSEHLQGYHTDSTREAIGRDGGTRSNENDNDNDNDNDDYDENEDDDDGDDNTTMLIISAEE